VPSEPLATTCAVVESGKAPAHDPDPRPDTLTDEQVTVTAETGTVEQLVNVEEAALSVRLQLLPDERALHVAVAVALPVTTGTVVGLVALKLTVAGLTVSVKLPTCGEAAMAPNFPTGITVGLAATAASKAMDSQPVIVLGGADSERRRRRVCSGGVYRIVGEGPRCRSRISGFG
jgi:hypothetical protein